MYIVLFLIRKFITFALQKPSPDMDEFDIITNRNKTGDLLTTNDSTTNISNNNGKYK